MKEVNATFEEPKVARFLFASTTMAWVWLVARVYIGYQWLQAGWEKVTGTESGWHWAFTQSSWLKSSAGLKGFAGYALTQTKGPHAAVNYGWYASFLRWIEHSGGWLAPIIAIGEVAIGVGLILGALTGISAFFGGMLSVSFGLAGVAGVNPLFMAIEFLAPRKAVRAGAPTEFCAELTSSRTAQSRTAQSRTAQKGESPWNTCFSPRGVYWSRSGPKGGMASRVP
jgi:thiosulfate dehydrogenase [quinone] large subunit